MVTFGTDHQSVKDFLAAVETAAPGAAICYALGNLAVSAPHSSELLLLRGTAQQMSSAGRGRLVQRRRRDVCFHTGGTCYEYLFAKAAG